MKATIELDGAIYEKYEYEGDSAAEIILQLMQDQDLDCLVRMGNMYGEDVAELERFMDKFHSGKLVSEDLKNLDITISIGTVKCIKFED